MFDTMCCKKLAKYFSAIALLPLILCMSCLSSSTGSHPLPKNITLKVNYGNAIIEVYGQVNDNLYRNNSIFDFGKIDSAKPLVVSKGAITINEKKQLSKGSEYSFTLQPTEVVSINVRSADNNDVEISVYEYGHEEIYSIKGDNKLGKMIAFQNR